MKAYGHSRKDKLECKYGCCTFKSGPKRSCREVVDRNNRKTARQEVKKIVKQMEDFSLPFFICAIGLF
jgi:hypothetical protein